MFNAGALDESCQDDACEGDVHSSDAVASESALEALQLFCCNRKVFGSEAVALEVIGMHAAGSLVRDCDGMAPPRCVVSLLLWRLGHGKLVHRLWQLPPTQALYEEELDGLDSWFSVAMSSSAWRGHVRTKRGSKRRVVPRRKVQSAPARVHSPAVGSEFQATKLNQQKPIVVNALVAAHDAKAMLLRFLGPGATSMGSTGVERGWWLHHVHNTNRTGVWSTNAGRQFRAVVVWKRQVRASLRRRIEFLAGTGDSGHNQQAQALAEECEALIEFLAGGARPQVLLASGSPEEPQVGDLNIGFDAFRRQLVADGVGI